MPRGTPCHAPSMQNFDLSLVLGCLALQTACVVTDGSGGSGGAGAGDATGGSSTAGGNDASCFAPTPFMGGGEFVAVDAATTQSFSFTTPDDLEGGVITIEVTGDQFFSDIRVAGADGYFEQLNGGGMPSARTRFVAAPAVTYEITIDEASVTATDESQEVTVSWSLETVVDCYEPDDSAAEATPLALGDTAKPFLFAGHTDNDWPTYEAHHDWFVIELESAGDLTLELVPPVASSEEESSVATAVQLRDANDTILLDSYTLADPIVEVVAVPAGTYFVRIEPFSSPPFAASVGVGANWYTPYELTVTAP